MSSFTGDLHVRLIGGTELMEVKKEISFFSSVHVPGLQIKCHPGFISDGDSIPGIIRPAVRASGRKYQNAYVVVHDPLYKLWAYYNRLFPTKTVPQHHELIEKITLKTADLLLDEGLQVLKLGWYARSKIYWGLRMFGDPGSIEENEEDWIKAAEHIELIQWKTVKQAEKACKISN